MRWWEQTLSSDFKRWRKDILKDLSLQAIFTSDLINAVMLRIISCGYKSHPSSTPDVLHDTFFKVTNPISMEDVLLWYVTNDFLPMNLSGKNKHLRFDVFWDLLLSVLFPHNVLLMGTSILIYRLHHLLREVLRSKDSLYH